MDDHLDETQSVALSVASDSSTTANITVARLSTFDEWFLSFFFNQRSTSSRFVSRLFTTLFPLQNVFSTIYPLQVQTLILLIPFFLEPNQISPILDLVLSHFFTAMDRYQFQI